jgi:hypothetical protein
MGNLSTFAELKLGIANWLGREELTNRIPEFVAMAEDRIAMDLRVQAMETTSDLTISSQRVSFPTGFLEVRRLYLNSSDDKPLDYFVPPVFWTRTFANETGQPDAFTIEGQEFVFAPSPSTTYTGKLLYYKRFTALSAAADTNWILSNARGLLLYGALIEAYTYLEDDAGTLKMAAMYDQLLSRVMNSDKIGRVPRGAQSMRSQVPVV